MAGHALFHLGLVAYTRDDRERARALCQEAVELFDARQSWLDAIEPLHYLGLNACAADDLPAAAAFFAEALVRLRVRRSRVDFANGFADVATLAVARGNLVAAARLFGVPTPSGGRMGRHSHCRPASPMSGGRPARIQLGDAAWSAAYAAGRRCRWITRFSRQRRW